MRTKITILLAIILFTGCELQYNIEINDDKINNYIEFDATKFDDGFNVDSVYDVYSILDGKNSKFYDKKINGDIIKFSYEYDITNFDKAYYLKTCFENYEFRNENGNYIIDAKGVFKCLPYQVNDYLMYDYDKLTLHIKTNEKVIKHNSDYNDGNDYYWYIDGKNTDNVRIYFEYQIIEDYDYSWLILLGGVIGIALLIVGFIHLKSSKNNQI